MIMYSSGYVLLLSLLCQGTLPEFQVTPLKGHSSSHLRHFWKSTGFCPPDPHQSAGDYFLSQDVLRNLLFISSLPHEAITNVRIHWLLDALKVKWRDGRLLFNWTKLDTFLTILWRLRLRPGFELMGNPSDVFSDMENATQLLYWKRMVYNIGKRYTRKYGKNWVSKWNFESWNEPDHHDTDSLNFTVKGYLNYWEASLKGLKGVSQGLKLGGPGGSCRPPHFTRLCYALLDYCNRSGYIDFISFHKKGNRDAMSMIAQEKEFIKIIQSEYKNLVNITLFNDEADILKGWWKAEEWRGDVRYAALVALSVVLHQQHYAGKVLISNDNAFLDYYPNVFQQRTLLARFQMNNTQPPHTQFILKPVYSVMGLLALLGNQVLDIEQYPQLNLTEMTTTRGNEYGQQEVSLLMIRNQDTYVQRDGELLNISVNLCFTLNGSKIVIYTLDNEKTNPMALWIKNGKPDFPTQKLMAALRDVQEPHRLSGPSTECNIHIGLMLPSVTVIHACQWRSELPGKVYNVHVQNVTSCEVLISWDDHFVKTRCIWSYEVEFSNTSSSTNFSRINKKDTFFNSFHFSLDRRKFKDNDINGYYRVRAKDYWGRYGAYSAIVEYGVDEHMMHKESF